MSTKHLCPKLPATTEVKNMVSNKILNDIFSKSKNGKSLIGIYENGKSDDFYVGYVVDFDTTFIAMQHVSQYGLKDGIHVKELATLDKVEVESDYLKGCQQLFDNENLLPEQSLESVELPPSDSWPYHFFNNNACIGELISFELKGEDLSYYGLLMDFDEDSFVIHLVGQVGESQDTSVFSMETIASLALDTLQCRKRLRLYDLRSKGRR